MKRLALLALVALTLPARACLNDRDSDSLATQAAQLPETLRVITGRFPRNPPLYYHMRIDRERAALKTNPRQFGLYDDIGVALDKLGKSDDALQTMKAKRAVLPAFDAKDKVNREAWYRTYANEGTFRAHRFLKWGAPVAKLDEMRTARAQIKRAIEIKPDAHFGRERYQLMAMDWIIARKSGATKKTLGEWIEGRDGWQDARAQDENRKRAVEGLSGMVVLGGAWESPDMFEALGRALSSAETVTLRHIAILRAQELLIAGNPSLGGLKPQTLTATLRENDGTGVGQKVAQKNYIPLASMFGELRYEADNWDSSRQWWMEKQLKEGQHPDTNTKFWNDYTETAPPSLKMNWVSRLTMEEDDRDALQQLAIWVLSVGVLLLSVRLFILGHRLKRRSNST